MADLSMRLHQEIRVKSHKMLWCLKVGAGAGTAMSVEADESFGSKISICMRTQVCMGAETHALHTTHRVASKTEVDQNSVTEMTFQTVKGTQQYIKC